MSVMNQIIVTTSRGLDELLKAEIEALCPDTACRLSPGTVTFTGTLEQAYHRFKGAGFAREMDLGGPAGEPVVVRGRSAQTPVATPQA